MKIVACLVFQCKPQNVHRALEAHLHRGECAITGPYPDTEPVKAYQPILALVFLTR